MVFMKRIEDPVALRLREQRIMGTVQDMLRDMDPTTPREGTSGTPMRVARMYVNELCSGYDVDIASLFSTFDTADYEGMVLLKDIPVVSTCEHHLVPIIGMAYVAYVPTDKVIGLSKIARVVDAFARRLQMQERLTQQIMEAITEHLSPKGVMVLIEAEHLCMTIRGVQKPGAKTVTSCVNGVFLDNKKGTKDEFLSLIRR